ncbi:MAG: NAD(P)-dependent oxidoreductase [Candidatus Latescibacterota bacterium]|nr:NAD(P)-dependent oxidoreductase [Candidatus Latescibacterota bacterium]
MSNRVVVTGADRALGAMLCRELARDYEIVACGVADDTAIGCRAVDLRSQDSVEQLVAGAHAVVHTQPYDPPKATEQELLHLITRGTYVLINAAAEAQVQRIVLISQLAVMERYPDHFVVDPSWRPLPAATAVSLAPYLAELTCREIARTGKIQVICQRLGALGAEDGTSEQDAATEVRRALAREMTRLEHQWRVSHVVSSGCFSGVGT